MLASVMICGLLLSLRSVCSELDHDFSEQKFAVVGYIPEWRYEGANWDYICRICTHVILFSLEPGPDGSIEAIDRIPRPPILALALEAAHRHKSKILICFGGNGRSNGFQSLVRSASARKRFVSNLVDLCQTYGPFSFVMLHQY